MKKLTKPLTSISLAVLLVCISIFSTMAIDLSNVTPDSQNPHLIQKVTALDGTSDTHQWVTDYDEENQTSYYCYPYALGETDIRFSPGETTSVSILKNLVRNNYVSVDEVAQLVVTDIENLGGTARILTGTNNSPTYQTASDEYLIAVRVTPESIYEKGDFDTYNYHFMRRINNNCWRYKAGTSGKVVQLEQGYTPENVTWDTITLKSGAESEYDYIQKNVGFYSSDIIYIVVSDYDQMSISSSSFPNIALQNAYLENTSVTLGKGALYQIKPVFTPSNASDQDIYWTIAKKYGSIDTSNQLITKGAGTFTASGLCNGNKSIILSLNVTILDILLGDVNSDGAINVTDATTLQLYLSGSETLTSDELFAADTNSDGSVNIRDVTLIQMYVAKHFSYFPVEQD